MVVSRATICGAAVILSAALCAGVRAQCQLANPSFEVPGQYGAPFGGWTAFGTVWASADMVPHGHVSAGCTGPYTGQWAVSGVWQPLDSSSGERWLVAVRVGHRAVNPLIGQARAIVNVEWRDAAGALISYETHTVADASTPADIMQRVQFETNPAPAGTVATHLLMGVLQSPAQEPGAAYFDLIEFQSLSRPSLDDLQWGDFPGGRAVDFGGRSWRVKGPGYYGPGPSPFSDSAEHVWVDESQRLHMTIRNVAGTWYSTEVATIEPPGYGDYIFTLAGRPDQWDENVVLGLFLWQYPLCYDPGNPWNLHNEVDVEISRMGVVGNELGQFVVQPWEWPGNMSRYALTCAAGALTSHAYRWLPDRIECRSWCGGPTAEAPDTLIHTWTYFGPHIPRPEQPRVHINFWQLNGPPSSGRDHEAIIDAFTFVPACADGASAWPCVAACLAGSGNAVPASCAPHDFDRDDDVDLADIAAFQAQYAGS